MSGALAVSVCLDKQSPIVTAFPMARQRDGGNLTFFVFVVGMGPCAPRMRLESRLLLDFTRGEGN